MQPCQRNLKDVSAVSPVQASLQCRLSHAREGPGKFREQPDAAGGKHGKEGVNCYANGRVSYFFYIGCSQDLSVGVQVFGECGRQWRQVLSLQQLCRA